MKAVLSSRANALEDFVTIFGDEKTMESLYPETYEAYINTRDGIVEDAKEVPEEFDIEIVHVSYTDAAKEYVQVDLRAVASDKSGYCILAAYSPQMAELSGEGAVKDLTAIPGDVSCDFTGNQEEVSLRLPAVSLKNGRGGILEGAEIAATLYTVDQTVHTYECRENLNLYGLDYSSEITLEAPVRTHKNQENKDINISYRYMGGQFTSDLRDYFYSSGDLADGNLRIPGKGSIHVEGVNLHRISSVTLTVVNAKGEGFCHNDADAVLSDDNTITWDMPDNWGNPYEDILDSLYCYVTYQLEIKAIGAGKQYTFLITNNQSITPSENKKVFERINIYKDCFEEGTLVRMSDGSEKKAEDIGITDSVDTPEGTVGVRDVQRISGVTVMVHIKAENGRELSVSGSHPLVTEQGLVCARFLKEGDQVYTGDGKVKITEICVTPGAEVTLYSIGLESVGRLYANGFLAGDSAAEMSAAELANNLRYQVPEEWRADYDSWAKRNKLSTRRF